MNRTTTERIPSPVAIALRATGMPTLSWSPPTSHSSIPANAVNTRISPTQSSKASKASSPVPGTPNQAKMNMIKISATPLRPASCTPNPGPLVFIAAPYSSRRIGLSGAAVAPSREPTSVVDRPAGLHPISLHQPRGPDRGHQDVGAAADAGEIAGPRVTDGHRGVGVQQQAGKRPADENRPPEDHRLRPPTLNPRLREKLHHALRGTRDEPRPALGEQPRASGGQAVHVLGGVDGTDHRILVDLLRERQLDQDPVPFVVAVQLPDQIQQLVPRGGGVEPL